jgi:hypothetical protein
MRSDAPSRSTETKLVLLADSREQYQFEIDRGLSYAPGTRPEYHEEPEAM